MTVFVSHPMAFAPAMRRSRYCYGCSSSRSSSSCCPGLGLVLLALLFAPLFARLALFVLAMHGMASIVFCLVGSVVNLCAPSPGWCCSQPRPAAARRPEASTEKIEPCTTKGTGSTVREQLAKERRDLSSARVVGATKEDGHDDDDREPHRAAADDEIKIVVGVPGVRIEDVSVEVLDNVLRVTGETAKGAHTYAVDRRILLPSTADVETMAATYADGEVAIAMRRKAGKRIAVVQRVNNTAVKQQPQVEEKGEPKEEVKEAPKRPPAVRAAAAVEDEATAESIEPPLQRKSAARPVARNEQELHEHEVEAEVTSEGAAPVAPPAPASTSSSEEDDDEWEALPREG